MTPETHGPEYGAAGSTRLLPPVQPDRPEDVEGARLWRAMFESSDDAVISKSLEGVITAWNAGAERMFGYSAEEAIGRSITLIIPRERLDEERRILAQIRRGERVESFQTVRVAKDGRRIDVSVAVAPVRDEDQRIIGAAKVARDITEQKSAEQELRAFKDRLSTDLAGMVLLDELSIELAQQGDLNSLLEQLLDAAIRITRADMGLVQLYDQFRGSLRIVAQRGFQPDFVDFCGEMRPGQPCISSAAAESSQRVIVEDVLRSPLFKGADREAAVRAGFRAVQATPLLSFSGRILGVFTTHYAVPKRPDDKDLRLLDLLARHAADFIERIQAEDAVENALERVNSVLSSITESYFALDSQLRFVEVNPAALRTVFLNVPVTELIGREIWQVFPQGAGSEFDRQYRRALEEQREVHFEARSRIVDKWFEVHAYPRYGRLEVYVRDITERKSAAEALAAREAEFRAMFELSAAGATQADPATGRFVRVNRRFCEMTGYSAEELLERTICDITHPEDCQRDQALAERVLRGECEAWEVEKRYVRKDGAIVWTVVAGRLIRDPTGRPLRTISTAIDITDRKRAEEDVRRKVQELAAADRRKDEFLALLGHELRNPLAAVVNGVQVLHGLASLPENGRAILDIVERQAGHMRRLIDDLLDVSRIARGKIALRLERLALNEVIERTIADHQALIKESGCTLEMQMPAGRVDVEGDAIRLAQAVANLLHNACKFTNPGGRITVSLEEDAAQQSAVVAVRDTGIGMDRAIQSKLFQAFSQADSSLERSRGGLGLGLALVKGLIELHGGSVTAGSEGPGAGSEFRIRLPLAGAASRAAPPPEPAAKTATPDHYRILVVDDTAPVAHMFALLLESMGHQVQTAESGKAALEQIPSFCPEVVISDISMPEMNGYQLARRLRGLPEGRDIVLVAMTGYGQPEDRQRALRSGFDFHVVKPAESTALDYLFEAIAKKIAQ